MSRSPSSCHEASTDSAMLQRAACTSAWINRCIPCRIQVARERCFFPSRELSCHSWVATDKIRCYLIASASNALLLLSLQDLQDYRQSIIIIIFFINSTCNHVTSNYSQGVVQVERNVAIHLKNKKMKIEWIHVNSLVSFSWKVFLQWIKIFGGSVFFGGRRSKTRRWTWRKQERGSRAFRRKRALWRFCTKLMKFIKEIFNRIFRYLHTKIHVYDAYFLLEYLF